MADLLDISLHLSVFDVVKTKNSSVNEEHNNHLKTFTINFGVFGSSLQMIL